MEAPKVIRIVAAVIMDEQGRMLVVRKRGTTAFMQPGGKFEAGETPLEALTREIAEELGASFDPATALLLGQFQAVAANEINHVVDAIVYAVTLDAPVEGVAAELEELRWIDPTDPGDIMLAPLSRNTILPLVKAHRI